MEPSKLPIQIWLLALLFDSATKKGFSCLEFQRQLGLSRYETAFRLMHKIRIYMGKREALYSLTEMIEYDECFVTVATKKSETGKFKRGKRSPRKASVAVDAESIPVENPMTGKSGKVCDYFKIEVLGKVDREHVNGFFKKNTEGDIVLFTDKNTAYADIKNIVDTHFTVVSGKEATNDTLRWLHKAISNPKRKLLGINHMIIYKFLQNYLNEFVSKLNRKYFGDRLFNRLVLASICPYVQL